MSPETIIVWKEGKSADTSQENFPVVDGKTLDKTNWLSFDADCCNGKFHRVIAISKELKHIFSEA